MNLRIKIPKLRSTNYAKVVGDCLYEFRGNIVLQREGIHDSDAQFTRDIGGKFSLLSNHFYYFGSLPIRIPKSLHHIIHTTQNCKLIRDEKTISLFEKWIGEYKNNYLHAEPQLQYAFENVKC